MRLKNPNTGTVVHVGDDLSGTLLAQGWVPADSVESKPEPVVTIDVTNIAEAVEKVQAQQPRRRGRPPKTQK